MRLGMFRQVDLREIWKDEALSLVRLGEGDWAGHPLRRSLFNCDNQLRAFILCRSDMVTKDH